MDELDNQAVAAPEETSTMSDYMEAMNEATGTTDDGQAEPEPHEPPQEPVDEGQPEYEPAPEDSEDDEEIQDGENPYGKFKDADTLYEAYQNLERKIGEREEYSRFGQDIADIAQQNGLTQQQVYDRLLAQQQQVAPTPPGQEKPWYDGITPADEQSKQQFMQAFLSNPQMVVERIKEQATLEAEKRAEEKFRREAKAEQIKQETHNAWSEQIKANPDLNDPNSELSRYVQDLEKESNWQIPAAKAVEIAKVLASKKEYDQLKQTVSARDKAQKASADSYSNKSVPPPATIPGSYEEAIEMGKRDVGRS